jgi:hypothetical protein
MDAVSSSETSVSFYYTKLKGSNLEVFLVIAMKTPNPLVLLSLFFDLEVEGSNCLIKCLYTSTRLHGTKSQNVVPFTVMLREHQFQCRRHTWPRNTKFPTPFVITLQM